MKKIISWNINGISSWGKRMESLDFLNKENPDIFCIQELKSSQDKFNGNNSYEISNNFNKESRENIEKILLKYPYQYYHFAEKKGYSGVSVFSKIKPKNIFFGLKDENKKEIDSEGRVLVLEFENLFLINVYTPNSKIDFSRIDYRINVWDRAFRIYLQKLKNEKNILVCGDMNVLACDIDLQNYNFFFKNKDFEKNILKERASFNEFLDLGLVDIYRKFFPEKIIFSWTGPWELSMPSTRLDYFLVDKKIEKEVKRIEIFDDYNLQSSSDHFPIMLEVENIFSKKDIDEDILKTDNVGKIKEKIIYPDIRKGDGEQLSLF